MLTVKNNAEGFGAMYQGLIFGFAHCKKNNIKYLHTKLTTIHHGANVKLANELIGMNHYEPANNNTPKLDYNRDIWGREDIDNLLTTDILKEIRDNYNGYESLKEVVCIHIRRGDLIKNNPHYQKRWDDLEQYIPVIEYFKKEYGYKIVICSESNRKKLSLLTDMFPDIEVNNMNTLDTFKFMTNCKVLFIARSSFSYVAGMLNKNIVYANAIDKKRWWHHRLQSWKLIDNLLF